MLDIEEEKNMPYITSYERDGIKKGIVLGRQEEKRSSILAVCKARQLSLTEEHRQRIEDCTDVDRLEAWHTRAVLADSADEIFAED